MKKEEQKKAEALVRQELHNKLSIQDRIKKAKSRPGGSAKEISKLEAMLAKQKTKVEKEK